MAQNNAQPQHTQAFSWIPILFVSLAAISAFWVLGSRGWFSTWHGFPNTASTTIFFLAAAAMVSRGIPPRYQWSIVAGLGCSAIGDAFLMLPKDYFIAGLASFLAAHLCYLWALTHDSRLATYKTPFIVWGLLGIALILVLWPGVARSLRIPVVLYAITLLAMAAQATSRAMAKPAAATLMAALGGSLFVISDAVLAYQRFIHPIEWGRVIVLGTYFAAQGGIAMSIVIARRS